MREYFEYKTINMKERPKHKPNKAPEVFCNLHWIKFSKIQAIGKIFEGFEADRLYVLGMESLNPGASLSDK